MMDTKDTLNIILSLIEMNILNESKVRVILELEE